MARSSRRCQPRSKCPRHYQLDAGHCSPLFFLTAAIDHLPSPLQFSVPTASQRNSPRVYFRCILMLLLVLLVAPHSTGVDRAAVPAPPRPPSSLQPPHHGQGALVHLTPCGFTRQLHLNVLMLIGSEVPPLPRQSHCDVCSLPCSRRRSRPRRWQTTSTMMPSSSSGQPDPR